MWVRGSQGPELVERRFEIALELERIEPLVEGLKFRPPAYPDAPDGTRDAAAEAQGILGQLSAKGFSRP